MYKLAYSRARKFVAVDYALSVRDWSHSGPNMKDHTYAHMHRMTYICRLILRVNKRVEEKVLQVDHAHVTLWAKPHGQIISLPST